MLTGFAALGLLLSQNGTVPAIGHVGLTAPIMIALYALSMRTVFEYERTHREEHSEEVARHYPDVTLRLAARRYAAAALGIAVVGIALPLVGAELADAMGWTRTFVGTLLVAGATSLPELVVTIAALRLGAVNMAIAGLLGSNLFNICILAIEDFLYLPGPLLAAVSPAHAISALSATIMAGVAIIGLQYRPKSRVLGTVGWVSLALFVIYLVNTYVLYLHGH
jgi:cation:H+ antiporter